jgi:hypothetical protein
MALSNWDTMALNEKGEPSHGEFTSPCGVSVEFYKNWLYVRDAKAWQEGGGYTEPTVMEIQPGDIRYKDVHILALRGPQNGVFAVVWTGYGDEVKGMAGCGVYGYEGMEWIGVTPESLTWWVAKLRGEHEETYNLSSYVTEPDGSSREEKLPEMKSMVPDLDVPDVFRKLEWGQALRFNQGDAFFAAAAGQATPGTAPGEAQPTVMSQMIPFLFPKQEGGSGPGEGGGEAGDG